MVCKGMLPVKHSLIIGSCVIDGLVVCKGMLPVKQNRDVVGGM